jgi:hypothetical protein
MAATGFTPILIYASGTTTNVPLAANLASGASGAELALNYTDGKLFYKDNAGSIQTIATKAGADGDVVGPASATSNNLAAFDGATGKLIKQANTVTVAQGGTGAATFTANNVLLGNGTSALQVVAPSTLGNVLTSNGTTWVSQAPAASGITTGKSIAMAMIFGF